MIIAREANWQAVGIQLACSVGNEAEALHVRIFPQRGRAFDRETRLLQRKKPCVGDEFTSLGCVVIAMTLVFRPVLGKPCDVGWPLDLRNAQAVVYGEDRKDGCAETQHD